LPSVSLMLAHKGIGSFLNTLVCSTESANIYNNKKFAILGKRVPFQLKNIL